MQVLDLESGTRRVLESRAGFVTAVAFSPDGRHLASATGVLVLLWDLTSGTRRALEGHTHPAYSLAFSPDGRHLASATGMLVLLWDLTSGTRLALQGHTSGVASVAFSPDGRQLASGSFDNTVRLWDLETGSSRPLEGHAGTVVSVAFSPDGWRLASGGKDGRVRLWNLDAAPGNETLGSLYSFTDGSWGVVDPEGRYDAANLGDVDGLHWVIQRQGHDEVIELRRFRDGYYDPGLLGSLWSQEPPALRPVPDPPERLP